MKFNYFLLLLFFSFPLSAQVTVKVDGTPITTDYQYDLFFCPEIITLENSDYDSLSFENSTVQYYNLEREQLSDEVIHSATININPTRILSAYEKAKEFPIMVNLGKVYGYKKGKKKLLVKNTTYKISYAPAKFNDPRQFNKINGSSKLKVMIGKDTLKSYQVSIADTSKRWRLVCPEPYRISSGEIVIIKILPEGAPMPVLMNLYSTGIQLEAVLKKMLPTLEKGYCIYFSKIILADTSTSSLSLRKEYYMVEVE